MFKRLLLLGYCVLLVLFVGIGFITAQSPNAWTNGRVNVRGGPSPSTDLLATFDPDTPLLLQGRSAGSGWLLGMNLTTSQRGWMSAGYLRFAPGFQIDKLPVSTETVSAATAHATTAGTLAPTPTSSIMATAWAPPEIPSQIMQAYHLKTPILPVIDSRMHAALKSIFAHGQQLGNYPNVFSKIGDCMTDAYFMYGLGTGDYNLGDYANLQAAVSYYSATIPGSSTNSFNAVSQASYSGLTANTVLSDEFTSVKGAGVCQKGEPMLQCEYRLHKPSVAVIMLGFSETQLMMVQNFTDYMQKIIQISIDRGVIPVLTTFPENQGRKQASRLMNKAIVDLASAYGIPVINLDLALYRLSDHGVDKLSHLTIAPIGSSNFSGVGLRYGMNVRTLLTLQVLDMIRQDLQKY